MEALNRKPDTTSVKKTMKLEDGTRIDLIGVSARKMRDLANDKKMSQYDKGIYLTALKIRVNGDPVVYDDLLDCFSSDELEAIVEFANDLDKNNDKGEDDPNE